MRSSPVGPMVEVGAGIGTSIDFSIQIASELAPGDTVSIDKAIDGYTLTGNTVNIAIRPDTLLVYQQQGLIIQGQVRWIASPAGYVLSLALTNMSSIVIPASFYSLRCVLAELISLGS